MGAVHGDMTGDRDRDILSETRSFCDAVRERTVVSPVAGLRERLKRDREQENVRCRRRLTTRDCPEGATRDSGRTAEFEDWRRRRGCKTTEKRRLWEGLQRFSRLGEVKWPKEKPEGAKEVGSTKRAFGRRDLKISQQAKLTGASNQASLYLSFCLWQVQMAVRADRTTCDDSLLMELPRLCGVDVLLSSQCISSRLALHWEGYLECTLRNPQPLLYLV